MEFLPFLPFMAESAPESFVLYYMSTVLFGYKPKVQTLIAAAVLTSIGSYIVRSMPINFGIHTVVELVSIVLILRLAFRLSMLLAVVATFLAAFLLGLAESISIPFLGWIFGLSLNKIISDPLYRVMFGLPHLVLLGLGTYIVQRKGWHLRVLKNALTGSRGVKTLGQSRRYFLLTVSLMQVVMLIFLNLNFYIYEARVFPTFQLSTMMVVTSVVIIASAVTTVFVANRLVKITYREARLEADLAHIREIQNLNLKTRSQRHDFYNHITSLYGFMRAEQYDDAKSYMESLYEDVREVKELLGLKPPVLGALLSLKRERAVKLGVDFTWELDLNHQELPLTTQELTQLLGNLLDNAIDAAASSDTGKRVLLTMEMNMLGLFIEVTNTSKPVTRSLLSSMFQPGISTKEGGEHGGLGLYIVKQIIDRHRGEIGVSSTEDYSGLEIQVIIPRKSAP